mmetsp:Transcript_148307/g.360036  ORF Transcript_148307/g.360036 Transcript_148307/m.360036 type:complete len:344 (+) Transcript_148307:89-1120(+)
MQPWPYKEKASGVLPTPARTYRKAREPSLALALRALVQEARAYADEEPNMPGRVGVVLPHGVVDENRDELANNTDHSEARRGDQLSEVEPCVGDGHANHAGEQEHQYSRQVPVCSHEPSRPQSDGAEQRQGQRQGVVVVDPRPGGHGDAVDHILHEHHLHNDEHVVGDYPCVALNMESLVSNDVDECTSSYGYQAHDASHAWQSSTEHQMFQEGHSYWGARSGHDDGLRIDGLQRLRVRQQAQEEHHASEKEWSTLLPSDQLDVTVTPHTPQCATRRRGHHELAEEDEGGVLHLADRHRVDQQQRRGAGRVECHGCGDGLGAGLRWRMGLWGDGFHVCPLTSA